MSGMILFGKYYFHVACIKTKLMRIKVEKTTTKNTKIKSSKKNRALNVFRESVVVAVVKAPSSHCPLCLENRVKLLFVSLVVVVVVV